MTGEKGLFERVGEGAIPGTFVGFSLGAARAYLQSRTIAEKSAANIAAAMSAKTPPTAAALRALQPKVRTSLRWWLVSDDLASHIENRSGRRRRRPTRLLTLLFTNAILSAFTHYSHFPLCSQPPRFTLRSEAHILVWRR